MKKILTSFLIVLLFKASAQPPIRVVPGLVTCGENSFYVKLTTDRYHVPVHNTSPVTCPDGTVHYDTEEGDFLDCKMELFADPNFTIPVPVDPRFFSFVRDVPGSSGTIDDPHIIYNYDCAAVLPPSSDYGDNWRVDHVLIWQEQCIWECVGTGYYNCSSIDLGEPANYNIVINCCYTPSVLAVRLLGFEGVRSSPSVNTLHWTLADTSDFARLELERSVDGLNYAVVYSTNEASISSFHDQMGVTSYYRLKLYSTNGAAFYSQVLVLKAGADLKSSFSVSPSPFGDQLRVLTSSLYPTLAIFRLISVDGKVVFEAERRLRAGINTFSIDIPPVARGIYMFSMSSENSTLSTKVMKQ
ncbi:T9SS type A sorting domain-containing protein [Ferruginibacter sp.]